MRTMKLPCLKFPWSNSQSAGTSDEPSVASLWFVLLISMLQVVIVPKIIIVNHVVQLERVFILGITLTAVQTTAVSTSIPPRPPAHLPAHF